MLVLSPCTGRQPRNLRNPSAFTYVRHWDGHMVIRIFNCVLQPSRSVYVKCEFSISRLSYNSAIPFSSELGVMYKLSSRDQVITGVGCPVAAHFSVTFEASRTITCSVVSDARMIGGTTGRKTSVD